MASTGARAEIRDGRNDRLAVVATAPCVGRRPFLVHLQALAAQFPAVESADGGAGLMAFHLDEAETRQRPENTSRVSRSREPAVSGE